MSAESLGRAGARELVLAALDKTRDTRAIEATLLALAARGETADEVLGGAEALRSRMVLFEHDFDDAVDTAGTGGDGLSSFNLSTAAALVAAAAGATVIKHGNRASSSSCGSADLLEALGIRLDLAPDAARRVLETVGITFLFAPRYHPAMGAVAALRRRLGVPTLFNLLGPLCNPGRVRRQLVGVASGARVAGFAAALEELGGERGLVVHGAGGADELTLAGPNLFRVVGAAKDLSALNTGSFDAARLQLPFAETRALQGGDAATNAAILHQVLAGEPSAIADATCLNAAACLMTAGVAASPEDGLARAFEAIESGAARRTLAAWIKASASAARKPAPALPDRLAPIVRSVETRLRKRQADGIAAAERASKRGHAFVAALKAPGISIIAECKRRSPSRGDFGSTLSVAERAALYAEGGARALSILTEQDHFGGAPGDLRAAAGAGLPRLRKDFLIHVDMVTESVAMGADAVLLICAILPGAKLQELRTAARELGLAVLVEAHNEDELERALEVGPECVGINARDLVTFEVDLARSLQLVRRVAALPSPPLLAAESGIKTAADVARAADAGADAVLVGEALMCAADPRRELERLLGAPHVR